MYKLLLVICMLPVALLMHAQQTDEEMAMRLFFRMKHAVNHSAHAAAQQLDERALAEGEYRLDRDEALETALLYLRENLRLDDELAPLPDSVLVSPVEIVEFEVVHPHAGATMWYETAAGDRIRFDRPGVVLIVRVEYPQVYGVLDPIVWTVRGADQLTLFG